MTSLRIVSAWAGVILFGGAAMLCVPAGIEAGSLIAIQDEPAAIADHALAKSFGAHVAAREIEAALAAGDLDLAQSFLDLAHDRGVAVPALLAERFAAAVKRSNSATVHAASFARGFITGEPENAVALAGTTTGDLLVFGDIRDAVREGGRYVAGKPADELVLGLALAGIVVTAGTYASAGVAAPARIGLSIVKAARKIGHLGAPVTAWVGRGLRDTVKVGKADGLVHLTSDLGRIQTRASTRAAVDALKVAQTPQEVTRVARLAEKKGSQTRAILKLLGRGAILLSVATLNLAWWMLGAIVTLFGLVSSLKRGVERMTQHCLDRRRLRRLRRDLAGIAARA